MSEVEVISFDEDEDPSGSPLSKGWRTVPSWRMDDFLSWISRYYRNVESLRALDYTALQRLVHTYISETGETTYSLNDWVKSLERGRYI